MAQVWSIEKYEVDSVSNSNLEVVMAGKADHFEHVETQDLESPQLEPISCSPMPPDSQVEEPGHHDESQVGGSQFDQEDSQGDSGLSQDTLRLSPNVHQFSPKALPSPDQPEESPTTEEGKEEEIPQEEDEEESDGRLTPPCGFVLSSHGMVHGDTSIAQDNPMLAMIMSAMSGVLAQKLVEREEDAEMGQGKGKGKVGSKGGEGKGYDAGTGASSSFMTPVSKPKAKSKSKSMAKKGKFAKKY